MRTLLETGKTDPAADNDYCLRWSSTKGYTEIVRLLIETGRVQLNACNNTPLKWASRNGHVDIVRMLLAHSLSDNNDDNNYSASSSSSSNSRYNVDVAADGDYALSWARNNRHYGVVKLLEDYYRDHDIVEGSRKDP